MELKNKNSEEFPGKNIKQHRGKKTYDALITTCFKLLKKREYDSITVAELSRSAGYSVGAFYARFESKDEFFNAMVAHHLKTRHETLEQLFSTFHYDDFIDDLIKNIVQYFWTYHKFWRAALVRSMRDPDFWEPIRKSGHNVANRVINRLSERSCHTLNEQEETNVRFAFQITFGTINNSIINQPGPIFMKQKLFTEKLIRAFRLVSNYDKIIKEK